LFIRKSWKFVPTTVEQCRGEMLTETEQRVLKEGCQVLFSFISVDSKILDLLGRLFIF
jgi:hypothetical protein